MDQGSAQTLSGSVTNSVASVTTRQINETPAQFPLFVSPKFTIPDEFNVDLGPWLNRPFYCGTSAWSTTDTRFSLLANPLRILPRNAFLSNGSLASIIRAATLFRCKLCVNITLTGSLSHSGLILVSATPPNGTAENGISVDGGKAINTMLSGPHAFLAANEASSICLEIPFYCNTDYAVLDFPSGVSSSPDFCTNGMNFASLNVMVLNPLQGGTGASTSVSLVYEAFFKSIELKIPRPQLATWSSTPPSFTNKTGESFLVKAGTKLLDSSFNILKTTSADALDALRGTIRRYTGLHNPNNPVLDTKQMMSYRNYHNTTDSGVCYERLDPYSTMDRITQEPSFQTLTDEMRVSNIISKPQYLGSFSVSTTTNTGALLFAGPISPYQGGAEQGKYIANNIELLYHLTRAWKGDINLHIQSSMNGKQNVKLKIVKVYCPSNSAQGSFPKMNEVASCPSDLIEFSQGNQVHDIKLPFLSRNSLMYNTRNYSASNVLVGSYFIYLAQPLVVGDSSPLSCEFNVYMSCADNFQFYGYSTEVGVLYNVTPPASELLPTPPPPIPKPVKTTKLGQSLEVMNKPSDAPSMHIHNSKETDLDDSRLVPLVDIRPLIRRNQFAFSESITIDPVVGYTNKLISLAPLIAEAYDGIARGSVGLIPGMFYGKQCGLKFKLVCTGNSMTNVSFIPPNVNVAPGGSSVITRAVPGITNDGFWYNLPPGNIHPGFYPVPQVEFPQIWSINNDGPLAEYEFSIPNTSIFNFIGGPEKNFPTNVTDVTYANADLGSIVLTFSGTPSTIVNYVLYYSYTDESRLGFQVQAPLVRPVPGNVAGTWCSPYSLASGTNPLSTSITFFTNSPNSYK